MYARLLYYKVIFIGVARSISCGKSKSSRAEGEDGDAQNAREGLLENPVTVELIDIPVFQCDKLGISIGSVAAQKLVQKRIMNVPDPGKVEAGAFEGDRVAAGAERRSNSQISSGIMRWALEGQADGFLLFFVSKVDVDIAARK